MRKIEYLLLLFLILFADKIKSQHTTTLDSLTNLVVKQKGLDRIDTLNELAWVYRKTNDSLATYYANQAIELGSSVKYTSGLATGYIRLGTIHLNNNRFQEAEKNILLALNLEEKENNLSGVARAKVQLGKLYKSTQDFDNSLKLYKESLQIRQQQKNNKKVALVYNNIARVYEDKKEPKNALEYYYKSIDLRKKINDTKGLIIVYKNLGVLYNNLKNYSTALLELEKGKKLCLKSNDSLQLASIYLNMGSSHNYLQEIDAAFIYFNQSLDIKKKLGIKQKGAIYNNIGTIYEKKNDLKKAIEFYSKSETVAKQNKNEIQLIDTYHNLGKAYKKQGEHTKGLDYYQEALKLAEKRKKNYRILDILSSIGKAYEELKDFRNAALYNEKHIVLRNQLEKESLRNQQSMTFLKDERNENRIITSEKEKIVAQKQKIEAEKEKKNIQFYASIIGCVLLSILFFMLFSSYRLKKRAVIAQKNEKIKQVEIEELLKKQELKSIHAMIDGQEKERKRIAQDLHDRLGSMLSVVKIHYQSVEENLDKIKAASREQYHKANQLLDEACVAVREISHNMISGVLTKFGLIPALKELVENVESTNRLDIELVDYGFDDRIENRIEIGIYRIVQELISNILKHANATEVSIQLLKREDGINITVIDNGVGFDTRNTANYSGMGLKGVASRVENLDGELHLDSGKGNGTTVTIEIPLETQITNL